MMFLLVILLTNYGDASRNSRAFLLRSSIKQQLGSNEFLRIKRYQITKDPGMGKNQIFNLRVAVQGWLSGWLWGSRSSCSYKFLTGEHWCLWWQTQCGSEHIPFCPCGSATGTCRGREL